jgi:hypothetical protein
MSAVSLVPPVPMRRRFPVGHGAGLARRVGHGLVARAVTYPDQFTRRYGRSQAPSR